MQLILSTACVKPHYKLPFLRIATPEAHAARPKTAPHGVLALHHRHIQRDLGIQHLADRAALFGLARRLLDHRAVALA